MKAVFWILLVVGLVVANAQHSIFDHSAYDRLLEKYVANGLVDYAAIKQDHRLLDKYLDQLEHIDADEFETWSREEKMALWINAYNAITIAGIVQNYPIQYGGLIARLRFPQQSIRQIKDFWDTVFIRVMGKELTLNDIEHRILRPQFQDPRIHFALVCAALGCPELRSGAYSGDSLNIQLDHDAYRFFHNPDKVRLDRQRNILYLSAILDWYAEDFKVSEEGKERFSAYSKAYRGVIEFTVQYLPESDREFVVQHHPRIKFLAYDWLLNEQK